MIKGFKYHIYPNSTQEKQLAQMLDNSRFVYNWALQTRIAAYQKDKTSMSAFTLMKDLTQMKKEEGKEWLSLSVAQSLQQSIVNMEKAFTKFFRDKKGFPNFKKKSDNQKVGFPQNTKINFETNRVFIPKLDWIPTRISRTFEGKIKTSTIGKKASGNYYISITVEMPDAKVKQKPIKRQTAIGIDTGIKTFATISDGSEIANNRYLKSSLKKLKTLQRRVSKKIKGSANRKKAVKKLARFHEHISNQRLDFLHKTTTEIANRKGVDTVVVENLHIKGMMANHCFAQSIADLGLGNFYRLLQYKLAERGKNYIEIGRFEPSSKVCSCGVVNKELTLADREWTCKSCGTHHPNRDMLAANNILNFGLQKQNLITG